MRGFFVAASVIGSSVVFASPASAKLVVDWGGTNYATSDTAFTAGVGNNKGGFSAGNPLALTVGSAATSSQLYGQVNWTTTGADGLYGAIDDNTGADRIEIKRYNTDIAGLVLWRKSDFLNGASTETVSFNGTSNIKTVISSFTGFSAGRLVIRLQGGANDGYYISDTAPLASATTYNISPATLTWRAYDPASDLRTLGTVTSIASGGIINNVSEVGFYARSTATAANAFRVSEFEVDAVGTAAPAVPEPASVGLMTVGALGLLARRRKH